MSKYIDYNVLLTESEVNILNQMQEDLSDRFPETFNDRMLKLIKSGHEKYYANKETGENLILAKIPLLRFRYDTMRLRKKYNIDLIQFYVKDILERYSQFLEYGEIMND